MPKVNEAYKRQKQEEILMAAKRVINKKSLPLISMRDIIAETGFSQGAIYRYFNHIDEIFLTLLNDDIDYEAKIDEVDAIQHTEDSPEKIIKAYFNFYQDLVFDGQLGKGKIAVGLDNLYIFDRERHNQFVSKCKIFGIIEHFLATYQRYIKTKVDEGYFKPMLDLSEIFHFVSISMYGAINDYSVENNEATFTLIDTIYKATLLFLGGQVNED